MPRRTKEEAEHTREAILSAALELFYEKGFSRTTFDEIAKRINLTKGAVYWHFRNKVDLLAAIMRDKIVKKRAKLALQDIEVNSLRGLREAFRRVAVSVESDPEYCKFLFFVIFRMEWSEIVAENTFIQIRELLDSPREQLKERLTFLQKNEEITSKMNVADLTVLLTCLWRGCLDAYVSKKCPLKLSVTFMQGFDLIMNGLKVEKK